MPSCILRLIEKDRLEEEAAALAHMHGVYHAFPYAAMPFALGPQPPPVAILPAAAASSPLCSDAPLVKAPPVKPPPPIRHEAVGYFAAADCRGSAPPADGPPPAQPVPWSVHAGRPLPPPPRPATAADYGTGAAAEWGSSVAPAEAPPTQPAPSHSRPPPPRAAAPTWKDHFPVDERICDLHARNLLPLLLTNDSLPITALTRGIDTKKNLTWALAGFIGTDRDWNPKTLVACHYGGQLTRMAEAVSVGLNLLPAGVAAGSGVLVTVAAWKKLCSIIAAGKIPQAVAVTHGWLHYKALVIITEQAFSEWVWFKNAADVNVDDIMADFLLGVASVLQGFGIETTLESPLAAPARSVKDRNCEMIIRHYARDNLLNASWCEGAPFGVEEDCWASYCPCPCISLHWLVQ